MERTLTSFRRIYENSCSELRIEPSFAVIEAIQKQSFNKGPQQLDLASIALGAKVKIQTVTT